MQQTSSIATTNLSSALTTTIISNDDNDYDNTIENSGRGIFIHNPIVNNTEPPNIGCYSTTKESAIKACQQNGYNLEYVSNEFRDDEDVVMTAIQNHGYFAIKYASQRLRNNYNIVLEACRVGGYYALRYASPTLQMNRDLFLIACTSHVYGNPLVVHDYSGGVVSSSKELVSSFNNDKEVVLTLCRNNGLTLQYVSKELQCDYDVVMTACQQTGYALEYACPKLQANKQIVLIAVQKTPFAIRFASEELRGSKDIALRCFEDTKNLGDIDAIKYLSKDLRGDKSWILQVYFDKRKIGKFIFGRALEHVSAQLQGDKSFVMLAVKDYGRALQFASKTLQDDKDIVTIALENNPKALEFASKTLQGHKGLVWNCIKRNGMCLKYASSELQGDIALVKSACSNAGLALQYASSDLQANKDIVMIACQNDATALRFASNELRGNEQVATTSIDRWARYPSLAQCPLHFVSPELRGNKVIALKVCEHIGLALELVSDSLKDDRDVVTTACRQNGWSLQFASDRLRADKEVILIAVSVNGEALKFALDDMNQDKDCLIAAGIWDAADVVNDSSRWNDLNHVKPLIVLSTRFALNEDSSPAATQFTLDLKKHREILGKFRVYSPNAYKKSTCDEAWTRIEWPCRGTYDTCQKPHHLKIGKPQIESCWRYSFRYQLEQARHTNGCMVQVVEKNEQGCYELGKGQQIEIQMAESVGIKVFRIRVGLKIDTMFDLIYHQILPHCLGWEYTQSALVSLQATLPRKRKTN